MIRREERQEKEMKLKGIVFDFNGTMYIDGDKQEAAWFEFFQRHADGKYTVRQLHKMIHGINGGEFLKIALNPDLTEQEIYDLTEEKEDIYREMCLNDPKGINFTEGLPEFLNKLKEHAVPFAIATASAIGNVRFYMKHMHLTHWIPAEHIVYDDGTFRGKPEPDIYLMAMERIGLSPEECVVLRMQMQGLKRPGEQERERLLPLDPKKSMRGFLGSRELRLSLRISEKSDWICWKLSDREKTGVQENKFQDTCFLFHSSLITQIFSDQNDFDPVFLSASSCDQQMGADGGITVAFPTVSGDGTRSFQSQADRIRTGGLASRPVHALFHGAYHLIHSYDQNYLSRSIA